LIKTKAESPMLRFIQKCLIMIHKEKWFKKEI